MASHYSSLGFIFKSEKHFQQITEKLAADAEPFEASEGSYWRWTSPSGAEVWLQVNEENELIGAQPHYAGDSAVRIRATAHVRRPEDTQLDGAFHAWANPTEEADGDYPFVFDCANFRQVSDVALPAEGFVQIAAFAHEITRYESAEAYDRAQTDEPKLAALSFIPAGLFAPAPQPPMAHAMFAGEVLRAERKMNEAGGGAFLWLAVRTYGGTFDVVADPELLPRVPAAGNVVTGSFWLSGVVRELTPHRLARFPK